MPSREGISSRNEYKLLLYAKEAEKIVYGTVRVARRKIKNSDCPCADLTLIYCLCLCVTGISSTN